MDFPVISQPVLSHAQTVEKNRVIYHDKKHPYICIIEIINVCDKVCQLVATGRWFSLDTQVSSTNKTMVTM